MVIIHPTTAQCAQKLLIPCVEFSPGENFHTFRHPLSLVKLYHVNFYHGKQDMATFTVLAKILSIKFFCNTKIPGLGEIFI